ncbi:MAG: polysaccharide deacetylase family protein [Methylobacter sp.]|nr:polysaccharide deacetylase family protein [Methylobacter sp.]
MKSAYFNRPWRPTLMIKGSFLLIVASVVAVVVRPDIWPWAAIVVVIDHALLTIAGLWPRCTLLGSNWNALPEASASRGEIAITIDDGPDPEVTPTVLDLLDRHDVKATFFCIGEKARRHPDLCREIADRGHAVENHSMHHRHHFSFLLLGGYFSELAAAQETLASITGIRPSFFRAPAGLRNPLLDPVLSRLGLQLASWTRRGFDTAEKDPQIVLAKLLDGLKAGDILLLHDGNAARTATGVPVILEVLPSLLDAVAAAKLRPVTLREALPVSVRES